MIGVVSIVSLLLPAAGLCGTTVAIWEVRVFQGIPRESAVIFEDALTTAVRNAQCFKTVTAFSSLQQASRAPAAGTEDDAQLAEVAGALGVDFLLLGSVARLPDKVNVILKLIDVHNAATVASVSRYLDGEDEGVALLAMEGLVQELLHPAPPQQPPPNTPTPPQQPPVARPAAAAGVELPVLPSYGLVTVLGVAGLMLGAAGLLAAVNVALGVTGMVLPAILRPLSVAAFVVMLLSMGGMLAGTTGLVGAAVVANLRRPRPPRTLELVVGGGVAAVGAAAAGAIGLGVAVLVSVVAFNLSRLGGSFNASALLPVVGLGLCCCCTAVPGTALGGVSLFGIFTARNMEGLDNKVEPQGSSQ